MSYSFEVCISFGEVFLSDDEKACALVVYPEKKRVTLHSTLLDLQLVFRAVGLGNVVKTLKREKLIHSMQPQEQITYLWFIGVDPVAQQKGIGSRLLHEVIAHSKANNRTVLLETSMQRNIPWYEKHGFKQYGELDLGHRLYLFRRDVER
jgi:ribosomal protein S18 acetylase RimI-like enzyme